MAETFITPEQSAELEQLREEYIAATARAAAAIVGAAGGMASDAFLEAEAETAAIVRRIKEIRGTTGKHWMS